ncbi:hypothetical protein V5799_019238 [Amblyomma americanum]|uniref:Uncharacterized protein n=1 Tax=Amblyomma americanum TaxID=6943 RepID=A0AAQ4EYA5_AMBAM
MKSTNARNMEVVERTPAKPEEFEVRGQRYASKKGKYVPLEKSAQRIAKERAAEKQAGRKVAPISVEKQITPVPNGAEKIILRPCGALVCLVKCGAAYLTGAVKTAAGVNHREEKNDVVSLNMKQHSILVVTTSAERKLRYASLAHIIFDGEKIGTTAYVATPEDCGKGEIHDVPLDYSIEEIVHRLDWRDKLKILGLGRLSKKSRTVLILFEEREVPRYIVLSEVSLRCYLYRKKY